MKTKRYFTVIELLVVLAVILVIFSVLCHSFTRAKEIARRAYCLNNLKQISTLANLYNVDRGAAPYTQHWLVDFTFCSDYLQDFRVLECPSMDDRVRTASDLNGNTSYHYMGSRQDWLRNNIASGDGTEYGFDASNPAIMNLINNREEKLVYDKTDNVHCGIFNVVYVESSSAEFFSVNESNKFWFVAESGSLNFPEGTAVASTASSSAVTVASTDAGSGTTGSGNSGSTDSGTTTVASSGGSGTTGSGSSDSTDSSSTTAVASSGGTSSTDASGSAGSGTSTSSSNTGTSTTTVASTTTTTTTDSGKSNNGHGNNADGVDVSNPGQGQGGPNGTTDASGTVDDETKGGSTTTTSTTTTTTTTTSTGGTTTSTSTTCTDTDKTNNGKKK